MSIHGFVLNSPSSLLKINRLNKKMRVAPSFPRQKLLSYWRVRCEHFEKRVMTDFSAFDNPCIEMFDPILKLINQLSFSRSHFMPSFIKQFYSIKTN